MNSLEIEKGKFINLNNVDEIGFREDEKWANAYKIIVTFSNGKTKEWTVDDDVGKKLEQKVKASSLL